MGPEAMMAVLVFNLPPYGSGISGKMSLSFPTINKRYGPPCTLDVRTHWPDRGFFPQWIYAISGRLRSIN